MRKNDDNAINMTDARDGSKWSTANAKYQDFFRQIVTRFEFQDALLIDAAGNVVFNACKGCRSRHQHRDGSLLGSKLQAAFAKAMSSNAVDYVGFTDFEFYQPAENTPTAWMVAPLRRDGRPEGVLALQFPITKINRLMTFDKQWKEAGPRRDGRDHPGRPG